MACKNIFHIKDVIMHEKKLLLSHRKENIEMSEFDENAGQSLSNVQTEMSPEESDKMTQDLMMLVLRLMSGQSFME